MQLTSPPFCSIYTLCCVPPPSTSTNAKMHPGCHLCFCTFSTVVLLFNGDLFSSQSSQKGNPWKKHQEHFLKMALLMCRGKKCIRVGVWEQPFWVQKRQSSCHRQILHFGSLFWVTDPGSWLGQYIINRLFRPWSKHIKVLNVSKGKFGQWKKQFPPKANWNSEYHLRKQQSISDRCKRPRALENIDTCATTIKCRHSCYCITTKPLGEHE